MKINFINIEKIMGVILNSRSSYKNLEKGIFELSNFFHDIIGQEGINEIIHIQETQTTSGIALDPMGAKNCFLDVWRTVKYIRGLHNAIIKIKEKIPRDLYHIVYAGCGPFAPLLLPLLKIIDTTRLKFTLIDINQSSLDQVQKILNAFKLNRENIRLICADAAKYQFESNEPVHLVFLEAMTAALYKEGHVAISYNLGSQLEEGGVLIPEEINIKAVLVNPQIEFNSNRIDLIRRGQVQASNHRIELGEVFKLNLNKIKFESQKNSKNYHPGLKIKIPERVDKKYQMMLATEINVFGDIVINEYESGLTTPRAYSLNDNFKANNVIQFYYKTEGVPSIIHRVV
ncbi:MAG: class I SAM-dependent methyltransferase [bacterium]